MTKASNETQQKDLAATLEKLWKTLERDYYANFEVDKKIEEINNDLTTNYQPISIFVAHEEWIKEKIEQNDKNITKIFEVENDIEDDIKDINRRMMIKVDKDQLQKVKMDLKRFALYDDFKDLYNKTMKPMQIF